MSTLTPLCLALSLPLSMHCPHTRTRRARTRNAIPAYASFPRRPSARAARR